MIPTRTLGTNGPTTGMLGLGCMGMSEVFGPADRDETIATIHAALEAGVTLLDTGDYYAMGRNELLIREALKGGKRDRALISVKYGMLRGPDRRWIGMDTRPEATKNFLSYTLERLGTDYIDIYRPGRLDPDVPIEETIGAIAELIEDGYVRYAGLSEVGAETLRRANAVHPIADLQIEYSLISRGIEDEILPTCRELGVGITAYGVLSHGLISGHWSKDRTGRPGELRGFLPRFADENIDHNLALVEALRRVAEAGRASVAQVAIGWVLAQGEDIAPLIGARTRERLTEALGGIGLDLTPEDLADIENAIPRGSATGTRYPAEQMAMLDSERGATKVG